MHISLSLYIYIYIYTEETSSPYLHLLNSQVLGFTVACHGEALPAISDRERGRIPLSE